MLLARYQFVWWPRLQFWFVRDTAPLGHVYSWRMSMGPLEVRRWKVTPEAAPWLSEVYSNKALHGNAQASASGSREHTASRLINGRGATPDLVRKLREYADYRATGDELSRILWQAADELEASHE